MLSTFQFTKNLNSLARVSYATLVNKCLNDSPGVDPIGTRPIMTASSTLSPKDDAKNNVPSRASKMKLLHKISLDAALGPNARRLMSSKSGGRDKCSKEEQPRCSKMNLEKSGCMEKKKKEKENPDSVSPFKSMWYNPECCVEQCAGVLPRFDELYYVISDKAKRKYQQTWHDCPTPRVVKKAVCCFDKLDMLPIERRSPKKKPKTACEPEEDPCKSRTKGDCPRFVLKGCRKVRNPPNCFVIRGITNCKKVCAPYPAFSECKKPKLKKGKIVECECLKNSSMCEVWEIVKKKENFKKNK